MKKDDLNSEGISLLMFFILGVLLGGVIGYSANNSVDKTKLYTHEKMSDEIILQPNEECIESNTVQYFAGFENHHTYVEVYCKKCNIEYICYRTEFDTCVVDSWSTNPIQNRTYCTKAHVVRVIV